MKISQKEKMELGNTGIRKTKISKKNYVIVGVIMLIIVIIVSIEMLTKRGMMHLFVPIALPIETSLVALFMTSAYTQKQRRILDAKGIESGSSEFAEEKDFKEFNKYNAEPLKEPYVNFEDNYIISQNLYATSNSYDANLNTVHEIIMGESGTGKGFTCLQPNILQANSSYVIADPSGELIRNTGKYLLEKGYKIKIVNIKNPRFSDKYNPLKYIYDQKDVFILADIIVENTKDKNAKTDAFFESQLKSMLISIILLLWTRFPADLNLGKVMFLIETAEVDEQNPKSKSFLDKLFADEHRDYGNTLAYQNYRIWHKGSPKTINNIISSTATRLGLFTLDETKAITSSDTLELEKLGKEKMAIFVTTPIIGGKVTFQALVSMLYSQIFMTILHTADTLKDYTLYEKIPYKHYRTEEEFQGNFFEKMFRKVINNYGTETRYKDGEVLYTNPDEEEVTNYIKKIEKSEIAKLKSITGTKKAPCGLIYRNEKGEEELLKRFDGTSVEENKRLCKEWKEKFKNTRIFKSETEFLPENIRFLIDEFPSIGNIPSFEEILKNFRKYNSSITIIVQSLSDLKKMYPDGWEGIVGNCTIKKFLGGQDPFTLEYLQKLLGQGTVKVGNESIQGGALGKGGSKSYSQQGRAIADISELAKMDKDECIVFVTGLKPFNDKKYNTLKHPNIEYLGGKYNIKRNLRIEDLFIEGLLEDKKSILEKRAEEYAKALSEKEYGRARAISQQFLDKGKISSQKEVNLKTNAYTKVSMENISEDVIIFGN